MSREKRIANWSKYGLWTSCMNEHFQIVVREGIKRQNSSAWEPKLNQLRSPWLSCHFYLTDDKLSKSSLTLLIYSVVLKPAESHNKSESIKNKGAILERAIQGLLSQTKGYL